VASSPVATRWELAGTDHTRLCTLLAAGSLLASCRKVARK
jgi:hypothetical protein